MNHRDLIMVATIHTPFTASISDLKKNPMEIALSGKGEAVVILNRNTPAFYCVPPELYQQMLERLKLQDHS